MSATDLTKHEETKAARSSLKPLVDIYEGGEGFLVRLDVPGVGKGDFDIRVQDHLLTVEGRKAHGGWNYHRTFALSRDLDVEKISAEAEHGVLTVSIPKSEKAKPKQIEVKVG